MTMPESPDDIIEIHYAERPFLKLRSGRTVAVVDAFPYRLGMPYIDGMEDFAKYVRTGDRRQLLQNLLVIGTRADACNALTITIEQELKEAFK